MNTELALRVKDRILREHKRVDMCKWVKNRGPFGLCGTTCCIAGHTIEEYGGRVPTHQLAEPGLIAGHLLGISTEESGYLFYIHDTYKAGPYVDLALELQMYRPGTIEYASVVARAIDLCISRHADGDPAPTLEMIDEVIEQLEINHG